MKVWRRIADRGREFFGLGLLSRDFINFAKMHSFYVIATNLSGTFVNTFLFASNSSFVTVGLYNLCLYAFEIMSYFVVCALMTRMKQTTLSRIGLLLYTMGYITLLLFQNNSASFFPLVSLFIGMGTAFYWAPYHDYAITFSNHSNRQFSISFLGILTNALILIAPPLSGFFISYLPGISGYTAVFGVTVVTFICSALLSRTLPSSAVRSHGNQLVNLIRREFYRASVRNMLFAHMIWGLRDGVFMYFLNILVYSMISDEFVVGLNLAGRSLAAVLVFSLIAKRIPMRKNYKMMIGGLVTSALLCLGFSLVEAGIWGAGFVILVNISDSGLSNIVFNGLQFFSYDMCDDLTRESRYARITVIGLRNAAMCVGRIVSVALLIFLSGHLSNMVILVGLNIIALPFVLFVKKGYNALEKEQTAEEGEA